MLSLVEAKGDCLLWVTSQIEGRLLKRFEHGFDLPGVEAFSSAFG